MKLPGFIVALFGSCCLAVSANGHEVITCKSPDGKFALRHVYQDQQPFAGDTAIIEVATGKTVAPLDSNWEIGELKLLWSHDSQRVSYFADNTHTTANAVEAYKWLLLAARQGDEDAKAYMTLMESKMLKPEQITERQKRASDFKPR